MKLTGKQKDVLVDAASFGICMGLLYAFIAVSTAASWCIVEVFAK